MRCTTASPRRRRFFSVRVVLNGQKTSSLSPSRTPIAAQFTSPSLPVVVTTVSISGTSSRASADKAEELLTGALIVAQPAAQRRGDGARTRLQDAANRHARVFGAEHDPDAARREFLL